MRLLILILFALGAVAAAGPLREIVRGALSSGAAPMPSLANARAAPPAASGTLSLHADSNGHFQVEAVVEGRSLRMLVDTGATLCAFKQDDAERIGIRLRPGDFTREVTTANGPVKVAPVRIGLVRLGPITVRDVEAVVIPRGLLADNLLGMSFLKRVRDFSVAGGRLTLRG